MERDAMPREHGIKLEFLERVKCGDPFVEHRVAHIRKAGFHQVPGAHDSFFRQKHNRIALRVAPAKKKKLDFALATK